MSVSQPLASKGQYVVCSNCLTLRPMKDFIVEKKIQLEQGVVTEVLIRCPECNDEKHSCYQDDLLREHRKILEKNVRELSKEQTQNNLMLLNDAKQGYAQAFDACQQRYKFLMEKAAD